jgi:hypothetical protein
MGQWPMQECFQRDSAALDIAKLKVIAKPITGVLAREL